MNWYDITGWKFVNLFAQMITGFILMGIIFGILYLLSIYV